MLVGESPPAKSQSVSVWKQDNPSGNNTIQQGGEAQDLEFEVPLGYIVGLRAAWATCRDPFLGKKIGLSIQSQQHKPSDCVSDEFGRACESVEVPSTHTKQTQLVTNFLAQMEKRLQGNKPNF